MDFVLRGTRFGEISVSCTRCFKIVYQTDQWITFATLGTLLEEHVPACPIGDTNDDAALRVMTNPSA